MGFDSLEFSDIFRRFTERAKREGEAAPTRLNEAEFHLIYNLYGAQLMKFCYCMMGNWGEAEEVTHDAFIKVFSGQWTHFPDKGLMYRLATQACISQLRKRRHTDVGYLDDEVAENMASNEPGPEDEALIDERRVELARLIARLPFQERTVMLLIWRGFTRGEIADILGIDPRAVSSRRHRAYGKLRTWLDIEV